MNTPRPILVAFNNIIYHLSGAKCLGNISNDRNFSLYKFDKDGVKVLVAWNDRKYSKVPLKQFGSKFIAYDYLGNKIDRNELIVDKSYITIGDKPIFFIIK
jgi:hypothetical protein